MGCELHEIMEAIEGSKSILNKLISLCEEDLSNEETLRVSRELDELLNIYNSVTQDRTESSQETMDFFMDEETF
ncbi:MAG: hypothetical protein K0R09_759 [Clostridiales bacterium]|jgi:hypothetical protein|nr:hypothetical protein [Clostridiales bacterium]